MTEIKNLMPLNLMDCTLELSDHEYEQKRCDEYNSLQGKNFDNSVFFEVYDCPICKNKLYIAFVNDYDEFSLRECECKIKRKALVNIRKSGLTEELRRKTFDTYITTEKWQENSRNIAAEYLNSGSDSWLFAGGQSGSGKTHICTAICNKLLNQGKSVRYILWRELSRKLSANRFSDDYEEIISDIMQYDAIYIDDFLKSAKPVNEIDFAFELINSAYTRRKRVIISSELLLSDIYKIDSAVAGRIKELSGDFIIQIPKNPDRNYRLKI